MEAEQQQQHLDKDDVCTLFALAEKFDKEFFHEKKDADGGVWWLQVCIVVVCVVDNVVICVVVGDC